MYIYIYIHSSNKKHQKVALQCHNIAAESILYTIQIVHSYHGSIGNVKLLMKKQTLNMISVTANNIVKRWLMKLFNIINP